MTGREDDEVMSVMAGTTSLIPESEQEGFVKTANQNYGTISFIPSQNHACDYDSVIFFIFD